MHSAFKSNFAVSILFVGILSSLIFGESKIPIKNGSKILFIGNSYTGTRCGLRNYLAKACEAATPPFSIVTDEVILWGQQLNAHVADGTAMTKIQKGGWDIVVIQGYSDAHGTVQQVNLFFENVRYFDTAIKKIGAQTVLYMPWAYNPSVDWYTNPYDHFKTGSKALNENYTKIGKEIGAPVVPIGQIWLDLTAKPPKTGLPLNYLWFQPATGKTDIHQSVESSCINAWAFYTTLRRASPVGIHINTDFCKDGPGPAADLELPFQQRVWDIVTTRDDWPKVTIAPNTHKNLVPTSEQSSNNSSDKSLNGRTVSKENSTALQPIVKKKGQLNINAIR